ncbi:MAG TPA: hypothetical protein VHT49_03430 [Acidimicrobiales bacterium]|nr:hypothetical protein [Acidimicrobiales bacterium]
MPVGDPFGVLDGAPVPEAAAEVLGVVVAVGDGDTVAQNWAMVSLCAWASSVSWGKLFWALLVLAPLDVAAQAVHCPKALAPRAGLGLPPWLLPVDAPPPAAGEDWLLAAEAPPLEVLAALFRCDEG